MYQVDQALVVKAHTCAHKNMEMSSKSWGPSTIWVGKDAFDGAVCLHLAGSRRMDEVECWKDLDRPAQVQLDNARELAGWGPAARTLSRVIRLFQPRLFQRLFQRPTDLRQELARSTRGFGGDAGPAPQGSAAGEIAAGLRRAGRPSAALGGRVIFIPG